MDVPEEDVRSLIRDKYDGKDADLAGDIARLAAGEPLAYVIGWVPFYGLRIDLDTRPLIPRPETEYWTEKLIAHLRQRFGDTSFTLLDLCAGSGAIGLAVLKELPNAHVTFVELDSAHASLIGNNITLNGLDSARADIRSGDLFAPVAGMQFDVIATNPPYVPTLRTLPESVGAHEPHGALFSGPDGLSLIRRIATEARNHLTEGGEVWLECDISHVTEAGTLMRADGATRCAINEDQYGRPRTVVSYYP